MINTFSYRFKVSTSIVLGLLINKTYSLNNAQACRLSAQYVRAIMQDSIGRNIIDVTNQLSFVYQELASKLSIFISPPTKLVKAADFIRAFEEK